MFLLGLPELLQVQHKKFDFVSNAACVQADFAGCSKFCFSRALPATLCGDMEYEHIKQYAVATWQCLTLHKAKPTNDTQAQNAK